MALRERVESIPDPIRSSVIYLTMGSFPSKPSYAVYQKLLESSEYAAWFYCYGYRANHFTIQVNALETFSSLSMLNDFLKQEGYVFNEAGGIIKGSVEAGLMQSSTQAEKVTMSFEEGDYEVPCCYYEFAERFEGEDGKLFSGFVEGSADRLFESTNRS